MGQAATYLMVFFVAFNLFAGGIQAAGIDSAIGLDATVGDNAAVDNRVDDASAFDSGTATGETLFGSNNVLTSQVADFFGVIFPGLNMMRRAGLPDFLVASILGPLFSIFVFIAGVSILRGFDV